MISELKRKIEIVKEKVESFLLTFFINKDEYNDIKLKLIELIEQIENLNPFEKEEFLIDIEDEFGLLVQLYVKKAKSIKHKNIYTNIEVSEIEEAINSYYKAREHYYKYHEDEQMPWEYDVNELKQLL